MSMLSEEFDVFGGGVRCIVKAESREALAELEEEVEEAVGGRKVTGRPSSSSTPSGLRVSSGMLPLFIASLKESEWSLVGASGESVSG